MRSLAVIALLGLGVGVARTADAFPENRRMLKTKYGKAVSCGACHANGGGSELNAFGHDWEAAGGDSAAFDKIAEKDSDKDGIANKAELVGGSNPGDAASTPENPGRVWLTESKTVPIPESQLSLVLGDTDRIEALELELDDAHAKAIEKAVGHAIDEGARAPTFYFGISGGQKKTIAMFSHFDRKDGKYALLVAVAASGTIAKVAMFRAGASDPNKFRPYLDCLVGHAKTDFPVSGCPAAPEQHAVEASVQESMWVIASAFDGSAPAKPAPVVAAADVAPTTDDVAPAPSDGQLDFSHAVTTTGVERHGSAVGNLVAFASLALFVVLVVLSARFSVRFSRSTAPSSWLRTMPAHFRLLSALLVLSLMLALAGGATEAYLQVAVVHGGAAEYFHQMSLPHLVGITHAHLFGYAMCYGTIAALACCSSIGDGWKRVLVSALMWAGPADVASWWGIRAMSPRFELLTNAAGIASCVAALIALIAIGRDLVAPAKENTP
jgi:hypothetical protein